MGLRRSWFYGKYQMILLSILTMQWKGRNCEEQTEELPGFKIEAPVNVIVQRGLCVLIPCNFTVGPKYNLTKDAIGIWYKGHPNDPVAASTNSSQFPDTTNGRFIFTGKVSAGDCSFSISDAQPGDAAKYRFRLEDRDPLKFNYLHIQPSVSVTEEPEISPTGDLIADKEVTVTCTAPTNCPGLSPNFTWEGSVNTDNIQNNTSRHQNGTVTYRSNITFTPSPRHHNSSLTCTVIYTNESTNTNITLNVEYPPTLIISVSGGTGESSRLIMREGDSQEIYCKVDSNPTANIIWTRGKSPVENIQQNGQNVTLSLRNVTENDSDTYTCTAQNQRGNNSRSISVSVESLQKPQTNFLIVGLCILFLTLVVVIAVFVFRRMRKKKDLQEDRTTKEMPKSDSDGIYNDMDNMKIYDLHIDIEEAKLDKDYSDLHINNETEVQYSSLDFSNIKPKEDPQTEIIYSEVKRK
ncbi:uncharacterized protein LOC494843 [Xenopus laevis]|uniref:Uncharacterized protein LOC494843 n=2 Tax=Xenopus laevis TaxID=8355 RepID=A0A8J0PZJ1_XENLA|nr:uncharacterized protein LOC494843 [Xenopus laevis]